MSLSKCDVTGSTDRVQLLPEYMQTDKVKKVCFRVALKMERERIEGKPVKKDEVKKEEKKPEPKKPVKKKSKKKAKK